MHKVGASLRTLISAAAAPTAATERNPNINKLKDTTRIDQTNGTKEVNFVCVTFVASFFFFSLRPARNHSHDDDDDDGPNGDKLPARSVVCSFRATTGKLVTQLVG